MVAYLPLPPVPQKTNHRLWKVLAEGFTCNIVFFMFFFFQPVGAALLSTLEKGLGENFTSEAREAWTTVYGVVADTMKEGAKEIQDV